MSQLTLSQIVGGVSRETLTSRRKMSNRETRARNDCLRKVKLRRPFLQSIKQAGPRTMPVTIKQAGPRTMPVTIKQAGPRTMPVTIKQAVHPQDLGLCL